MNSYIDYILLPEQLTFRIQKSFHVKNMIINGHNQGDDNSLRVNSSISFYCFFLISLGMIFKRFWLFSMRFLNCLKL